MCPIIKMHLKRQGHGGLGGERELCLTMRTGQGGNLKEALLIYMGEFIVEIII